MYIQVNNNAGVVIGGGFSAETVRAHVLVAHIWWHSTLRWMNFVLNHDEQARELAGGVTISIIANGTEDSVLTF